LRYPPASPSARVGPRHIGPVAECIDDGRQYRIEPYARILYFFRDRVVQTAAKIVLEPIFEADFEDSAYGYRPRRSLSVSRSTQAFEAARQKRSHSLNGLSVKRQVEPLELHLRGHAQAETAVDDFKDNQ
jgi:hypothetical protein